MFVPRNHNACGEYEGVEESFEIERVKQRQSEKEDMNQIKRTV
jgi:hypothetical protein